MMMLREIAIWIVQGILFLIGIGMAGLAAHLGGELVASVFDIDDSIPKTLMFFGAEALVVWAGNRFWPTSWLPNPLL